MKIKIVPIVLSGLLVMVSLCAITQTRASYLVGTTQSVDELIDEALNESRDKGAGALIPSTPVEQKAVAYQPMNMSDVSRHRIVKRSDMLCDRYVKSSTCFSAENFTSRDCQGWAFPFALQVSYASGSFDECGNSSSLGNLIFKQELTLQDLCLFCRLCAQNKVHISHAGFANPPERNVPVTIMPGEKFGDFASDLYPTLIAPARVGFSCVEQCEVGGVLTIMRHLHSWCDNRVELTAGVTVPVVSRLHTLGMPKLVGGFLLHEVFIPDQTHRETSMDRFWRAFTGIDDFFIRQVLQADGIVLECRQQKTGFGDVSLFALCDWKEPISWYRIFDDIQFGLHVSLPTGGKEDVNKIWSPVLGNGGGWQIGLSAHIAFGSCGDWFNPVMRLVGEFNLPYTSCRRVSSLRSNGGVNNDAIMRVENVPGLKVPPFFGGFLVGPFAEFGAPVPFLGNEVARVRTRLGHRGLIMVGNYFYRPACLDLNLGIFYEYMRKGKDTVKLSACDGGLVIDDTALEYRTNQQSHTVSWHMVHGFSSGLEMTFGTRHVVAGKNVPRLHELFVTWLFHF